VKGIILSGSPCSVRDEDSPRVDESIFGDLPVLRDLLWSPIIGSSGGGLVQASGHREYGRAHMTTVKTSPLLADLSEKGQVWMSHGDTIMELPAQYELIGSTETVRVAAFAHVSKPIYGIQFHPEVTHSTEGSLLIKNFVVGICGCAQTWTSDSFVIGTVADLKAKLGNDKVVLGLSGGVDSSVAAVLLHRAIGTNLYCIFVDNGLLRKDEFEQVLGFLQRIRLKCERGECQGPSLFSLSWIKLNQRISGRRLAKRLLRYLIMRRI
jgi:GMP synthase (glutamine-hydrolysing)